jgi:hypothetical protein
MEYKVTFEDNRPVSAMLLQSITTEKLIDLTRRGNRRLMNWLIVVGDDEKDAIQMADSIVKEYWLKYLNKIFA